MSYRPHAAPTPMLFGYDPFRDLPKDHLARLVELVVEQADPPRKLSGLKGQPAFDPRLCAKVLIYSYATGVRSSRQMERLCKENLCYLFLTRDDKPSYRTLCSFRVEHSDLIGEIWLGLFVIAAHCGMKRMGRIVIDSSKFRADASPEAVIKAREYQPILDELMTILKESEITDLQEEIDPPGETSIGQNVDTDQIRDIVRRTRSDIRKLKTADPNMTEDETSEEMQNTSVPSKKPLGPQMLPRIQNAIITLEEAQRNGEKFACLTDPDARMMGEGREKNVRECHSFEVVVDHEDGLLVVGQSCQSPVDNPRLEPLVEAAKENEPVSISHVDADSGYYSGYSVGNLISEGIDICIPDSNTAGDLHRSQQIGITRSKTTGKIPLEYDAQSDCYRCPEENRLLPIYRKQYGGQEVMVYRSENSCRDCPQAADCLAKPGVKHRETKRGPYSDMLEAARQRFAEAEHQARYNHRGDAVEKVFGFIRSVLGYRRWQLRGKDRVASEAQLFKMAYQVRKVHLKWATTIL